MMGLTGRGDGGHVSWVSSVFLVLFTKLTLVGFIDVQEASGSCYFSSSTLECAPD